MTDQNVKLPYNQETNYREEENLIGLSLRGLMDLLTALGSKEANDLQNLYKRDTRTLRHELTSRIKAIFDADSSFSFDEDETAQDVVTTIAVSETLADDLVAQSDAEVDSDEDPLMARILDMASDSTTEDDAMEFVTERIDSMDRNALVNHAEKYVQVSESFGDYSTHDMRQTLLEHYQSVQESLADDEADEEMNDNVTSDSDEEFDVEEDFSEDVGSEFDAVDTAEQLDSESEEFDAEETEQEFEAEFEESDNEFDPDEEEDPDSDSEFVEDSSEEDDEEFEIEDDSEEDFDEESAIMDRIESSDYLMHSNLPHAELQTSSRILVKLHASSTDLGDLSSSKEELEATYNDNEITYDMRTPLRSASMAERNGRNVGWFAECVPAIARVLAEFNSVNRSYVGDIRSLQQTIHTIQQNLNNALDKVVHGTVGAIQLPEGMDISDFYQIDIQPNTLENDTEVSFDVVLNLLVPMLADLAPAKFEQAVNAIASQINKSVQNVADDTESYLEVSVHFAASMEVVINNDTIREFFADVPHYTENELFKIAEESEENFTAQFEAETESDDDTDETFVEDSDDVEENTEEDDDQFESESESDSTGSMLLDLCSTFSGLNVVTNWTTNIVSDDLL